MRSMVIGDHDFTNNIIEECDNHNYSGFLQSIKDQFHVNISKSNTAIFTTDAKGLFDVFLDHLPTQMRQHYNCSACRHFVNRYGNLVVIDNEGELEPIMWGESPEFFAPSVHAIRNQIIHSKVNGVFVSNHTDLGQSITGAWKHMSVTLPESFLSKSRLKTPYQIKAEKLEDFHTLQNALKEYPLDIVEAAIVLLKTEALYRSERCLGVAEWLQQLQKQIIHIKDNYKKDHIIWRVVALAPVGFCHVKSSMIGTLLDDIKAELPFESISKRFAEKMHPLQYQRPQASPTTGNILQAEKIIEKLGIQKSLYRRFARLDELETIWTPKEKKETKNSNGIFSHLISKEKKKQIKIEIPSITMTWKKFFETVLPTAEYMEFLAKDCLDNYTAILTAVHDDAPPILQWDKEECRNPFSLYVRIGGSHCRDWKLSVGYCKVTGICYRPSMWHDNFAHQGKGVIFILEGAKDKDYIGGNALFPENLRSELHVIRATIEAFSQKETIKGYEEASACGILLQHGLTWNYKVRVITPAGSAIYQLDRWD